VNRIALVLLVLAIFQQQHLYMIYRDALIAKYSPTDFGVSINEAYPQLLSPNGNSQLQDDLIANRAEWRALGKGWEGKTFVYNGTVIKTFTSGRSPFRNCAPGVLGEKWPTEIPGSLRFGGVHGANVTFEGFLPVLAYFMSSPSQSSPAEWHLVTPFLESGGLEQLAKRAYRDARGYREIDARYRPAFDRLLYSLGSLHEAGFCHDDVKPSNMFVKNDSHFVLGDLGNLRQIAHPYHSSRLWRENEQLADCRANDVLRALKSYLAFVQYAADDASQFNMDFFEGREPLSRLFWWTRIDKSITAAKLHAQSSIDKPQQPPTVSIGDDLCLPTPPSSFRGLFSRQWGLQSAVDHALNLRLADKKARHWALVWLFGIPVLDVCGA
jgi:hypothetical protein